MTTLAAISLWEPWASLMANGAKTIETRSWYTNYRGDLLICAAKRKDPDAMALRRSHGFCSYLGGRHRFHGDQFGNAVCIVRLIDCVRITDHVVRHTRFGDLRFGDFTTGRYAWKTDHLRPVNPFPVRGKQGLFTVDVDLDAVLGDADRPCGQL